MPSEVLKMTTEIVVAHSSVTELTPDQLVDEIKAVYNVLASLEGGAILEEPAPEKSEKTGGVKKPPIPLKDIVKKKYVVCLECGRKMRTMQKHVETDEVFVLLAGRCIMFLGEGEEAVTTIHAVDMEPSRLYNVKKDCWHSHTFSEDARVLIVENRDTVDANSPFARLSSYQQGEIMRLTRALWG